MIISLVSLNYPAQVDRLIGHVAAGSFDQWLLRYLYQGDSQDVLITTLYVGFFTTYPSVKVLFYPRYVCYAEYVTDRSLTCQGWLCACMCAYVYACGGSIFLQSDWLLSNCKAITLITLTLKVAISGIALAM